MTERSEKGNTALVDVARRINVQANSENDKFGVDPLTVIAIANLILTMIRLIYQCRSGRESVKEAAARPGPISRFFVRRAIAKNFPRSERKAVYNATLRVSGKMSGKELDEIIDYYEHTEKN